MNNCRLQITRKFLLSSQVQGNMNQLDFGDTLTLAFVGSICSDSRCFFMSLGAMSYNTGSDFRSALVSSLGSHHQNNESTSEGRRWHPSRWTDIWIEGFPMFQPSSFKEWACDAQVNVCMIEKMQVKLQKAGKAMWELFSTSMIELPCFYVAGIGLSAPT